MAKKTGVSRKDIHGQLWELLLAIETRDSPEIACWLCPATATGRDVTEDEFAADLHVAGWRCRASARFRAGGPTCPACMKIPQTLRGR